MKKIMMGLAVAVFVLGFVPFIYAAEKVVYYEVGDKGYFKYPWIEKNDFVIWPDKTKTGSSGFGALITSETKIMIANRDIGRKNLDLLTGKPVVAFARIKRVGEGEGSKEYCLSLTIFILSESTYQVPITVGASKK